MYTMTPLADIPPSHVGFWIIAFFCVGIWLLTMIDSTWHERIFYRVTTSALLGLAWLVSYVWTDQTTIVHKNEQVTGELVRFVAEGWSESRTSGKTTRQVDVHKTYVVYRINGSEVLFEANTGTEYPQRAVFYKN